MSEMPWLVGGMAGYSAATWAMWHGVLQGRVRDRLVLLALAGAVTLLAVAIAVRWVYTGYGPFLTLFEILLSNLFSLGLVYLVIYWRVPRARPGALVVLPILLLIGIWAAGESALPGKLPATYDSLLLWIHVLIGKLFLGICLAAVGLAGILLLRRMFGAGGFLNGLPADSVLDALVWKFISAAFVFHSGMLIAGAVWAQDAWGRYWDWDPLETWAFITWLAMGLSLHARVSCKVSQSIGWLMVLGIFTLAFLTFFGIPFSSLGPHKGVLQ